MSHDLDFTLGRAAIAFLGSREDIWHRHGQAMPAGQSIEQWATAAGLGWNAVAVPAIAALEGPAFAHIPASDILRRVDGQRFICRDDVGTPLGYVSDGYKIVQPRGLLAWFERYISVDQRFKLDVAGSLNGGRTIWATAVFNGDLDVAGDKHLARLLMSTTFDGSGATINQDCVTRVVCRNTMRVAHGEKGAVIKTRHSTHFDADKVGRELATLAQGFARYKAIGDAMAMHEMTREQVSAFFKQTLDIPFDAKKEDVSTRKLNQFSDLSRAFTTTQRERNTDRVDVWSALQAVTRYVDHDRATRKGDEANFVSSQFGSGDQLKGKAMQLLMPLIKDAVPVAA